MDRLKSSYGSCDFFTTAKLSLTLPSTALHGTIFLMNSDSLAGATSSSAANLNDDFFLLVFLTLTPLKRDPHWVLLPSLLALLGRGVEESVSSSSPSSLSSLSSSPSSSLKRPLSEEVLIRIFWKLLRRLLRLRFFRDRGGKRTTSFLSSLGEV
uniref:Uncharacterized protein n=1 Tax=Opuntia streptacantha TaxID=393608 RepID=A0A7C8YR04_OPUST